jgi:molybdopterin molybdotransferase
MTSWQDARALVHRAGTVHALPAETVALSAAAGRMLAAELVSHCYLPHFDNSAMDGWAVAGSAPWLEGSPVLAGSVPADRPLAPGHARPIATGAPVPQGTYSVLRSEDAVVERTDGGVLVDTLSPPEPGRDIRLHGEEAAPGDVLIAAGARLTPPRLGLLAATGATDVVAHAVPQVGFVAVGDELGHGGSRAHAGQIPDAITPMMPAILAALGGECRALATAPDRAAELAAVLTASEHSLLITTGGTARGPADPVRDAIALLGARVLLDGIDLRPGRSVLLAELPDGRLLLCLPGNPLAAVVDLVVLGEPLLRGLQGATSAEIADSHLDAGAVPGRGDRAIACTLEDGLPVPTPYQRSGMLRGIAGATHLALVGGTELFLQRLPWA